MAWTAAWALRDEGGDELPLAVTAELSVSYLRPTPSAPPLRIEARLVELSGPRVVVEAELTSDAKVRATSRGVFVPTADSLRGAARDTTGPADARDA
jgi:acyl-coenzyme A thioesterase PaaI-like protein